MHNPSDVQLINPVALISPKTSSFASGECENLLPPPRLLKSGISVPKDTEYKLSRYPKNLDVKSNTAHFTF